MKTFSSARPTLRFGVFELDPQTRELRKKGHEDQAARSASRTPHHAVAASRRSHHQEELQKKLWPADTFVDFEQGLNNAMKRPAPLETTPRQNETPTQLPKTDESEILPK